MQKWLLIIVACIVFGFSLLVHLPAQLVVPESSGKFQFVGIGGSVWRGEVEQVLLSGKALPIRDLAWSVNPMSLFAGNLQGNVHEKHEPDNRGNMSLSLRSRQLELQELHWRLPDNSLDPWFRAGVSLQGQFVLELQSLRFPPNTRFPSELEGRLDWENAALQMDGEYWQVGSPVLQFSTEGDAIEAVLTNVKPMLPGDGSVRCTAKNCQVALSLQPSPDAPQSMVNGLMLLGLQPAGNGYSGQMTFPLQYP